MRAYVVEELLKMPTDNDWFLEFRTIHRPTLTQRALVKLPVDLVKAYKDVNRTFYQGLLLTGHSIFDEPDFTEALAFVSDDLGLSIKTIAEITWDTFSLYDCSRARWYHENTWKWKLFKRL